MSDETKLAAFLSDGKRHIPALNLTLRPHTADTAAQLELARLTARKRLDAVRKELGDEAEATVKDLSIYYGAANVAFIHSQDCSGLVWKPADYWTALEQFLAGYTRAQINAAIPDLAAHLEAADKVQDWQIESNGDSPPN